MRFLIVAMLALAGGTPLAKERATTQPAGFAVRGKVAINGEWGFSKPDLGRAVVYLESDGKLDALGGEPKSASVSQKNKAFSPNFLVVRKGTNVEFPNWDQFEHNVFSRSKAAPAFDLERYPYGQSKSRIFDKVGVVQVFCNIHPQMRAIIVVTPNAFFARADEQGAFEIKDVPPGDYELVAWQERCEEARQKVHVGPGSATEISIRLEESRKSVLANDPPRHGAGYGVEHGLGVKREKLDLPVVKDSHPAPKEEK